MRRAICSSRGFTLIEMMVTIAVAAILGLLVVPNLVNMVDAGRTSVLVNKFPQDVAWARNQAVTTQQPVILTLGPSNCLWSVSVGGVVQPEHSLTQQQFSASYPNVQCTISGGNSQTLTFNTQGFISAAPSITIKAGQGQTWNLQMLSSGTVILNSNTAS